MTAYEWVVLKRRWCEVVQAYAELQEQRVYPSDVLPDMPAYRVTSRECSHGIVCNLIGSPCRWAFSESDNDPFEQAASVEPARPA